MKKQINTANGQSLEAKNTAAGQSAQPMQNRPQGQPRPVVRNADSARTPQQNVQQPVRQPAAQNVQRVQQPVKQNVPANRSTAEAPRRTEMPVHRNTSAQNPVQPQQSRMPQGTRENRRVQPAERSIPAESVRQNHPVQNGQRQAAVPAERAVPAVRSAASVPAAPKNVRGQMMKTRNTDLTPYAFEEPKPKKEKRVSSDEGGNTVVSVVKAVVYIIFIIVISVFLALCIIHIGNDMFSFVKSDEIVEVVIPEYATLDEVADILYRNDIIRYPTIFKLYAVSKKSDTDFLAGTYPVNGMTNYETLLDEFKEKPETGTVDITIPEGYTIDEMIDLFVNGYNIGTREGFVDVIQNGEFDYWFIRELEENGMDEDRLYRLEGYLFPDTYQFYKASSEYTVVNKMLKRFSQIFTKEYRAQCEVLGYTVDEMITLASLIEKEAESPAIFFTVSSVFHNRLNRPWQFTKFESDATIAYVLSHDKGERTTVTAADLLIDSPYNTYMYEGFPPGPIANPSASAMLAALQPEKTEFCYFVAHKGTTKFSATKEEHDAYIAEIRQESTAQPTTGDHPVQ